MVNAVTEYQTTVLYNKEFAGWDLRLAIGSEPHYFPGVKETTEYLICYRCVHDTETRKCRHAISLPKCRSDILTCDDPIREKQMFFKRFNRCARRGIERNCLMTISPLSFDCHSFFYSKIFNWGSSSIYNKNC